MFCQQFYVQNGINNCPEQETCDDKVDDCGPSFITTGCTNKPGSFFFYRISACVTTNKKVMSTNVNIPTPQSSITAPTPQNTPLTSAPITQQLSRPTVPDIQENEDEEDDSDLGQQDSSVRKGNANLGEAGVSGLGPEQRAVLSQLVHGKLNTLIGKSSGYIESLPVEVKKNIQGLVGVQAEYIKLQKEHKKEVLELEKKVRFLGYP